MSSPARTVLLTGANRGLGMAVAQRLARAGQRLVLTARDDIKARAVAHVLERESPGSAVVTRTLDLASLASVRALAERLVADGERIDVVLHNAGILFPSPTRTLTEDGLETCLQVHAVAPLLLTRLLLPALARPARVWGVGSSLHRPSSRGAAVDFRPDDPNLDQRYHPQRAYKNSKLALLWVAYALERRLGARGIHADVLSPGFIPTTAAENTTGLRQLALRRVLPLMPFATSLDDAADGVVRLVLDTPLEEPGGRYFQRGEVVGSSEQSRDEAEGERFWSWACTQVGLPPEVDAG